MSCFVIRGFGEKKDTQGRPIDFERIHRDLVAPAIHACGLSGGTTVEVVGAGQVHQDMFQLILQADIVVCDITVHNPNVFYELGVRHALRKKHTVLIKGRPSADATPFDIAGVRYMTYPVDEPASAVPDLVDAINASLARDRETDSPVFLMMPQLPAADVSHISTVPLSFAEEVQLAGARGDKGWLRVLAEDVRGATFEREGLRLVGRAQWKVKDFKGAAEAWKVVRAGAEQEVEANFALANVHDRLYKQTGDPAHLERSHQAIRRVLASDKLSPTERSEALALQGRDLKTLWRLDFAALDSLEARRERAIDARALQAYEAYREASRVDLNHFFSGLAALQMGHILQSLARNGNFRRLFQGDLRKAARYEEGLAEDLAMLQHVVQASIERSLATAKGDELGWARISAADLQFIRLGETPSPADIASLVGMYRDVAPKGSFFADAACGQLALFEQLDVVAKAAQDIRAALEGKAPKERHVVVFSGHSVDRAGAAAPRFPSAAQARARELIEARLQGLRGEGEELTVLCSAAPGADILALEACQRLGIPTRLCLPLERGAVGREVFRHYDDDWRNRFLTLADAHAGPPPGRTFVMSDSEHLPEWLRGTRRMTPWSRGNRWMLHQALAWGADKVTLLAFWDHDDADPSHEGTAAMVRLAREAAVFIQLIDSRPLAAR